MSISPYPNWRLKDGTNIFGPWRTPSPEGHDHVVTLEIGGRNWYFGHAGAPLTERQIAELREWARIVTAKMA